jgi:hypothetical protein
LDYIVRRENAQRKHRISQPLNRFHVVPFDQRPHEFVDGNTDTDRGMPRADMDTRLGSFGVKNVFLAIDRSLCAHIVSSTKS